MKTRSQIEIEREARDFVPSTVCDFAMMAAAERRFDKVFGNKGKVGRKLQRDRRDLGKQLVAEDRYDFQYHYIPDPFERNNWIYMSVTPGGDGLRAKEIVKSGRRKKQEVSGEIGTVTADSVSILMD